jgi:effector-binding domain-containing protein
VTGPLPEIGLREIPASEVHVVRRDPALRQSIYDLLAQALETVLAAGLSFEDLSGPPTLAYLRLPADPADPDDLEFEVRVPIELDAAAAHGLAVETDPGAPLVASAQFRGAHDLIPLIYEQLLHFIDAQGYSIIGLPLELYWEHTEDGEHLTELCIPVSEPI